MEALKYGREKGQTKKEAVSFDTTSSKKLGRLTSWR